MLANGAVLANVPWSTVMGDVDDMERSWRIINIFEMRRGAEVRGDDEVAGL